MTIVDANCIYTCNLARYIIICMDFYSEWLSNFYECYIYCYSDQTTADSSNVTNRVISIRITSSRFYEATQAMLTYRQQHYSPNFTRR